jgi:hypothetical protein
VTWWISYILARFSGSKTNANRKIRGMGAANLRFVALLITALTGMCTILPSNNIERLTTPFGGCKFISQSANLETCSPVEFDSKWVVLSTE